MGETEIETFKRPLSLVTRTDFRAFVPVRYNAVQILGNNRVLRRIDDQRQAVLRIPQLPAPSPIEFFIGTAQFFLNAFSIADVTDDAQHHRFAMRCNG